MSDLGLEVGLNGYENACVSLSPCMAIVRWVMHVRGMQCIKNCMEELSCE